MKTHLKALVAGMFLGTLSYAKLKKAAGGFVNPSIESAIEAPTTAEIPAEFRFSMALIVGLA